MSNADPNRVIAMLRDQIGGLTVELAIAAAERDQLAEQLAKHEEAPSADISPEV